MARDPLKFIEEAILQLEQEKDSVISDVQKATWRDDRAKGTIPRKTRRMLDEEAEDLGFTIVTPEQRPLPEGFRRRYLQWYSAVTAIVAANDPARLAEIGDKYATINNILEHSHVSKYQVLSLIDLITSQADLLSAVPNRLRYSKYDFELEAYSVLVDDQLEEARHLHSREFLRAAGALAGVTLERHLKNLLRKHSPPIKVPKTATLAKLNDLCKDTVYDLIAWRKIQHLSDLRNLCSHDKSREPTIGRRGRSFQSHPSQYGRDAHRRRDANRRRDFVGSGAGRFARVPSHHVDGRRGAEHADRRHVVRTSHRVRQS